MKDNSFKPIYGTLESNEGFYLGDICYVLSDDVYYGFWGDKTDYADGVYNNVLGEGSGFAVSGTAYGDGEYHDEECNTYYVDSGTLGAVPFELIRKHHRPDISGPGALGEVYFKVCGPSILTFDVEERGIFHVEIRTDGTKVLDITINTADEDDDDEDDDWEWDDEEDEE